MCAQETLLNCIAHKHTARTESSAESTGSVLQRELRLDKTKFWTFQIGYEIPKHELKSSDSSIEKMTEIQKSQLLKKFEVSQNTAKVYQK